MSFILKEQAIKIFESVTYQFTVVDENNNEFELRKTEDSNGEEYTIYQNGTWSEYYPKMELIEFIDSEIEF